MEISNGHHQAMESFPLKEVLPVNQGRPQPSSSSPHHLHQESMKASLTSHPHQGLRCPRCDSSNTKFCYYNNYSLSQPRYFCKACRRYWTKGGTLRNVPVGGGCRKNKRSHSSSSSSSLSSFSKKSTLPQERLDNFAVPSLSYQPSGISLAVSSLQEDAFFLGNPNPNPIVGHGFLDMLSEFVGSTNAGSSAIGGLQSGLYNEFGGDGDNGVVLPFDHEGLGVSSSTIAGVVATEASACTGHGGYWNGAGRISRSGFLSGFPYEIHDGV